MELALLEEGVNATKILAGDCCKASTRFGLGLYWCCAVLSGTGLLLYPAIGIGSGQ